MHVGVTTVPRIATVRVQMISGARDINNKTAHF